MKKSHLFFLVITIIVLGACNKQTIQPTPNDLGYDFQPLEKGHYVIYDVDSIIYDDFRRIVDTVSLEMKDEIGDMFLDDQGRESYIVQRSVRYNSTDPWLINHVYYITQDSFKLEWKEQNLRFIKMVYPVKLNKKWRGNRYINAQGDDIGFLNEWDYRYTDVLVPFNTGSRTYPKTHIIDQANVVVNDTSSTTIFNEFIYGREVFAQDVGMVYREITNWEFQPDGSAYRSGFTTIFRAKANN